MGTGVSSSAVVAEDVSKVFFSGREPVWALENFSLSLEPGSFTCIVGPSGRQVHFPADPGRARGAHRRHGDDAR